MTRVSVSIPISSLLNPIDKALDSLCTSPKLGHLMLSAPAVDYGHLRCHSPNTVPPTIPSTVTLPSLHAGTADCHSQSSLLIELPSLHSVMSDLAKELQEESPWDTRSMTYWLCHRKEGVSPDDLDDSSTYTDSEEYNSDSVDEFDDDEGSRSDHRGHDSSRPCGTHNHEKDDPRASLSTEHDPYDISGTFFVHASNCTDDIDVGRSETSSTHDGPTCVSLTTLSQNNNRPNGGPETYTIRLPSIENRLGFGVEQRAGVRSRPALLPFFDEETERFSYWDADICEKVVSYIFPGSETFGLELHDYHALQRSISLIGRNHPARANALKYLLEFYPLLTSRQDKFDVNAEFIAWYMLMKG